MLFGELKQVDKITEYLNPPLSKAIAGSIDLESSLYECFVVYFNIHTCIQVKVI